MKGVKDVTTQYTMQGVTGTFDEIYKRFGLVDRKTALRRVNQSKWPIEKAMTKPGGECANLTYCQTCFAVIYCGCKTCEHCGDLTPYGRRLANAVA